jgi:hypothetical protein
MATMLKRKLFWLVVWGIAFAYIEASIVVYLRKIYYPGGFSFPAVIIEPDIAAVEIIREITTQVFMWTVAELSCRSFQCRLAVFMFLFGIWDIFYYVFLKAALNWPASLADWDILFLVPLPWVGPVWAPVVVSLGMIWAGTVILIRNEQGKPLDLGPGFMLLEVAAGLVIIVSFLIPGQAVIHQAVPQHFPWYLFVMGFGAGLGVFGWKWRRESNK